MNKGRSNKRKSGSQKRKNDKAPVKAKPNYSQTEEIRLNKYIAHAGLCSRREADTYIAEGKVSVNGKVITELGAKVRRKDSVVVDGQHLSMEPFVYLLLHKSKDVITTTDDEKNRKTVMDEIEKATGYRVYPVGRLDRNTTGLLVLTNDGDLAHRLMHPSYKVKKTYEVKTNIPFSDTELEELANGIELEDGPVKAHGLKRFMDVPDLIEFSVFEGRNRLVRRMAEYFGKEVVKLKRTQYAGLNLKGVGRGRWRYLRQSEINDLRKLVKLETLDFNKH